MGLWPYSGTNETVRGIREAVITILDTGEPPPPPPPPSGSQDPSERVRDD